MLRVAAEAIETGHLFRSDAYLADIRYDTDKLVVIMTSPKGGETATVTFTEVIGFRMLDEGNLLEFWPVCASDHGWLFRVHKNGWFEQEISRPGFLHDKLPGLSEYFVASQNNCLSVLAGGKPSVEIDQTRRIVGLA